MLRLFSISSIALISLTLVACGGASSQKKAVPTKFGDQTLPVPAQAPSPTKKTEHTVPSMTPPSAPVTPTTIDPLPSAGPTSTDTSNSPATLTPEAPLAPAPTPVPTLVDPMDGKWGEFMLPVTLNNGKSAELRVFIVISRAAQTMTSLATYFVGEERKEFGPIELVSKVSIGETTIDFLEDQSATIETSEGPLTYALNKSTVTYVLDGDKLTLILSPGLETTLDRVR